MALRDKIAASRADSAADAKRRAEYSAILANDPVIRSIVENPETRLHFKSIAARAKELGINLEDDDAIRPSFSGRMPFVGKQNSWWDTYGPFVLGVGGIVGGGLAAGALGGGAGAASGGTGGAAATGGATAGGAATAGGGAATGGSAAAGGGFGLKAALGALERGGEIAGNMAAGRADARKAEAEYGLDRDRLSLDRAGMDRAGTLDLADLDLRRRESASALDKDNVRAAVLGGLLQGMEDVSIDVPEHIRPHVGKISGGLKPSAIVGREQIGADLQARMLPKVKSGETFDPVSFEDLPQLTDAPRSSGLDAALSALGTIGAGAGALDSLRRPTVQPTSRTAGYVSPTRTYAQGNTTTGPVSWR